MKTMELIESYEEWFRVMPTADPIAKHELLPQTVGQQMLKDGSHDIGYIRAVVAQVTNPRWRGEPLKCERQPQRGDDRTVAALRSTQGFGRLTGRHPDQRIGRALQGVPGYGRRSVFICTRLAIASRARPLELMLSPARMMPIIRRGRHHHTRRY
jgi:hypothetical protein